MPCIIKFRGVLAASFCLVSSLSFGGDPVGSAAGVVAPLRTAAPLLLAQAGASDPARAAMAAREALIKAAKAEGEVTMYIAATGLGEPLTQGMTSKYGINAKFVRLPTAALLQRYAAEAESGNLAADILLEASNAFAPEALKKGWIERLADAGVPAYSEGLFPKKFTDGTTAIITISPWGFVYNTNVLKGAQIPKDWPDALNPAFKGNVLLSNPRAADAYLSLWAALLKKYGESYLNRVREFNPRVFASAAPGTQALGAGEGTVLLVNIGGNVDSFKSKGAPVSFVVPPYTTGVEVHILMTARGKSKHPNAARLVADFAMSKEGNELINKVTTSVYDTANLPRDYESPELLTPARKEQLLKLLGV